MIERLTWFQRQFRFDLEPWLFPSLVERLRGTPARLSDRASKLSAATLVQHLSDDSWSIQENVGHLSDLEPLWLGRLQETLAGESDLRAADLSNTKTHQAQHDRAPFTSLLESFATQRAHYVRELEQLGPEDVVRSAMHPRLEQPMRVIDQAFFVAEHDDHHLARITEILRVAL